jgi:DNA-binding transcriptional LysR family regulator
MRFDLVDLRLFLNVLEALSITHGAERSNLALASASARIRGMEEVLGVPLLLRNRRGVSVSPAGQCLADHARLVLQQVERMRGDLGSFARGVIGSVRVLSNAAAFGEHFPRAISSFLSANPTISIDIEERESADIAEAIASGIADIGIASKAVVPDMLESFPFAIDRLVAVLPRGNELESRPQLAFREIVDRQFIGLSRESPLQKHLVGQAARLGVTMKVRVRVSSFDAICRMAEAAAGIGVVPEIAAKRCRRSMEISAVRLSDKWAARRLAICVRSSKELPLGAKRLVEHLRQASGSRSVS